MQPGNGRKGTGRAGDGSEGGGSEGKESQSQGRLSTNDGAEQPTEQLASPLPPGLRVADWSGGADNLCWHWILAARQLEHPTLLCRLPRWPPRQRRLHAKPTSAWMVHRSKHCATGHCHCSAVSGWRTACVVSCCTGVTTSRPNSACCDGSACAWRPAWRRGRCRRMWRHGRGFL